MPPPSFSPTSSPYQASPYAPTAILADDLKSGRLIRLFTTEVLHEKAYYISEPASPRLSRAAEVKIFKNWLLKEVTTD